MQLRVGGHSAQLLAATLTAAGQLQLSVSGSNGGLRIGGDTNLYRSGENVLKTDDHLQVDKNLYVGAGESVSYLYLQSSNDAYIYHSEVGQNSESWLFLESKADSGYSAIVSAF